MKKFLLLSYLVMTCAVMARAQLSLPQTWKFHTGDDPQWSDPNFNDDSWKSIAVGSPWESQGYADYNGFAWYRTKVGIPSSLKKESYLKGNLKIALGKIDDGDQVFLNGKIIGQNAEQPGNIEEGSWQAERVYQLPLDDPAIHWDGQNEFAVRVYDHSGNGGMYAGPYSISIADLTDFIQIDDQSDDFHFSDRKHFEKKIFLKTNNGQYDFSGELTIKLIDPIKQKVVHSTSKKVQFSEGQPFSYQYSTTLPNSQSYQVRYIFKESRSGKKVIAEEGVPYILTPTPSPKPKINGADVTGVRPDHPFLFRIPATGKRPMTFSVPDLPAGLHLNSETGIIKGSLSRKGTYTVHLTATNSLGKDTRVFTIKVGHLIGLTPAMGWNSWNAWGTSVNDKKIRSAADVMAEKGLVDHGWTYINIDDGWQSPDRAGDGEIVPNDKFPDMKKLTDYVHSQGLKMGIYSSPGPKTCGGFTGSYQHVAQDAQTYAKWGIDYLKYDWCSYGQIAPKNPDLAEMKKPYKLMQTALNDINRDIYYSLCQYGMGDVWKWGALVDGNSWRTTGDIRDNWASMSGIGFDQGKCAPYAEPGHWNDPDMLVVGKVGWGPNLHNSQLTPDEQYTHISLWCMLSAPLLIGCDMSQLNDFTLNLLTNDEVLAIDQDALGTEAVQVAATDSVLIYAKPLADGNKAVGIFNIGSKATDADLQFSVLGLKGKQNLRDVWRQKDLGAFTDHYLAKRIPSHGTLLLKISK